MMAPTQTVDLRLDSEQPGDEVFQIRAQRQQQLRFLQRRQDFRLQARLLQLRQQQWCSGFQFL